jgi:hypothetical protein
MYKCSSTLMYLHLTEDGMSFLLSIPRLPTPGLLDGITSKAKHICTLMSVKFSYTGQTKPIT